MVLLDSNTMAEAIRTKVNGSLLPKFINRNISLMGIVIKTNPNGRSFDIQTGDRQVVTVNLRQPLDDMVEGLVEVQGVVQGKGLVMCDYYINFPPELAETFDLELDNETAVLLNAIPNPWR
ncbi:replication protein A 14 kDa subunit-like [Homalodisca vitripennis]|uniref:replication protein A 14 kDa subunit-like n=1 Tax=Homalodisca vitripennis TaxID=197043 RepID=UPI001EEC2C7E|nr:replication protein A 14 kDa subunit-like [Homalodisca vitripennis]